MANRVTFLVDGFNLYHSVVDLHTDTGHNCRWLDIRSLCSSFLSAIGNCATLDAVYYFSALAYHKETRRPGTVKRHQTFLDALASTGIVAELAKFKPKQINYRCEKCGHQGTMVRHEEKETDVAIAAKLIELSTRGAVDGMVVLSGDTDLIPAILTARRLSGKPVYAILPYKRYNNAFDRVVARCFKLKPHHYVSHQLPDVIMLAGGTAIRKPSEWA